MGSAIRSTITENPLAQQSHIDRDQDHQEQRAKPRCAKEVSRDSPCEQQRPQTFRQLMQRIELNGSGQKRNVRERNSRARTVQFSHVMEG